MRARPYARYGQLLRAALLVGTTAVTSTVAFGQAPPSTDVVDVAAGDVGAGDVGEGGEKGAKALANVAGDQEAVEEAVATEQEAPQPDALLAPEAPPEIGSGLSDMLGPFIKSMLMLAVVVGLAYLTLHKGLGKLMTRAQAGKRIKVVERVSLDQRRSLYLVDIDGNEVVLAGGEGGVVHIASLARDNDGEMKINHNPPPKAGAKRTFKDVLQTPRDPTDNGSNAGGDDEQAS